MQDPAADFAAALAILATPLIVIFLVTWVPWIVAAYCAGAARNAGLPGLLLGLFFGPVGLVVAAFYDGRPGCAVCRERIQPWAKLCPHCRSKLRWDERGSVCSAAPDEGAAVTERPVAVAPRPTSTPVPVVAPRRPLSHQVRTWTHVSGRKLEGRYVDAGAGRVRLAREDGQIVELPLEKLCDEDRALVEQELAHG